MRTNIWYSFLILFPVLEFRKKTKMILEIIGRIYVIDKSNTNELHAIIKKKNPFVLLKVYKSTI